VACSSVAASKTVNADPLDSAFQVLPKRRGSAIVIAVANATITRAAGFSVGSDDDVSAAARGDRDAQLSGRVTVAAGALHRGQNVLPLHVLKGYVLPTPSTPSMATRFGPGGVDSRRRSSQPAARSTWSVVSYLSINGSAPILTTPSGFIDFNVWWQSTRLLERSRNRDS